MATVDNLRNELANYDGQNPSILSEISARHEGQASFLSDLVTLASDEEAVVSEGATWIIKALVEKGRTFRPHDIRRLVGGLDDVTAWQAQLHVCQSIRHVAVPREAEPILEQWVTTLLDAPRPLLRAWALDALCQQRGATSETKSLLKRMEADKAASVRARVRNLMAEFGVS